jgi:mannose-6-phosphate isomerase-like protein (cupin superfamily)
MKALTHTVLVAVAAFTCSVRDASAQAAATSEAQHATNAHAEHRVFMPGDLEWKPASPMLPAGAQSIVLSGDPRQPGPFTVRLKLPDGYKVPPHWHPADEHVTVLSGTFGISTGEQFDPSKGMEIGPGGFTVMPTGVRHFAWTKGETVIQVHALGPWAINYVNPADDPRKKTGQ